MASDLRGMFSVQGRAVPVDTDGGRELHDVVFDRVDLVDFGANYDPETGEGSYVLLAKRNRAHVAHDGGDTEMTTDQTSDAVDAMKAELDAANTRIAELEADVAKAAAAAADTEPEDIWKGVSEQVREMFEKQQQRLAEAEAIAKAEREQRLEREYYEKAATYSSLPGETTQLADVLRAVADNAPGVMEALCGVLKAADAAIAESALFVSQGSDATVSEASSKLESLAKARVADGRATTHAQAVDQVLAENPSLYDDYRAQRSN